MRYIEPTPILEGEDALRFIKELVKTNEKITSKTIEEVREKVFSIKFSVIM